MNELAHANSLFASNELKSFWIARDEMSNIISFAMNYKSILAGAETDKEFIESASPTMIGFALAADYDTFWPIFGHVNLPKEIMVNLFINEPDKWGKTVSVKSYIPGCHLARIVNVAPHLFEEYKLPLGTLPTNDLLSLLAFSDYAAKAITDDIGAIRSTTCLKAAINHCPSILENIDPANIKDMCLTTRALATFVVKLHTSGKMKVSPALARYLTSELLDIGLMTKTSKAMKHNMSILTELR